MYYCFIGIRCIICTGIDWICFSDFDSMKSEYTMNFNTLENVNIAKKKKDMGNACDGPIVDRICKKCGHNQMSYAAMQLRSADEGQTVFFTCVKCKYVNRNNV